MTSHDSFGAAADLKVGANTYRIYRLDAIARAGIGDVATLPYSLRILLENVGLFCNCYYCRIRYCFCLQSL
jgi:aconitate hydratase